MLTTSYVCLFSGNPKEEPGAIVCRVAQSFLRFGSYQIHASRGKEDLDIVRALADYAIKNHFSHIENMSKSESLSFSTGDEDHSVVDLTSNKYAGKFHLLKSITKLYLSNTPPRLDESWLGSLHQIIFLDLIKLFSLY